MIKFCSHCKQHITFDKIEQFWEKGHNEKKVVKLQRNFGRKQRDEDWMVKK